MREPELTATFRGRERQRKRSIQESDNRVLCKYYTPICAHSPLALFGIVWHCCALLRNRGWVFVIAICARLCKPSTLILISVTWTDSRTQDEHTRNRITTIRTILMIPFWSCGHFLFHAIGKNNTTSIYIYDCLILSRRSRSRIQFL